MTSARASSVRAAFGIQSPPSASTTEARNAALRSAAPNWGRGKASLPVPARRNHGLRIRPPPAYAYRPPPSRTGPSSRRPECRSSRAVHGCACLEIIKPCLQSTASYLYVPVTTLEDDASSSLHGCRSSRAVAGCACLGIKPCSKPEYCLCRLYTVDVARWLCRLERHQGYTYTL
ncbi:uncharacterized protein LOC144160123 [Haemaphysalis longicornis]